MKTLITGGTGLVGRHLVTALQERGDSVRVLAVPTEETTWLEQRGVAVYHGDIRQSDTLIAPMRGVDTVFHLAALQGLWVPIEEYYKVNVTGTEHVCRAALAVGVRRLVHVSSWTAYGMALGRPADEGFPMAPWHDPYWITKARGDQLVRQMITEERLPAAIIRPGTIFGPGDRLNFGRIAERVRAGKSLIIGSGGNAVPLVYVTDVVQGLLLCADREQAMGQVYNITNDQSLTQEEFLGAIADEMGVAPPHIHLPYTAAYAAAYAAEHIARFTRAQHPIVTRHGVVLYGTDNRLSIEKARGELGFVPQVSLREGVRRAAAWYQQQQQGASARHVSLVDARLTAPSGRRRQDKEGTKKVRATNRPLVDQVVLITGASSGIGAATARELARRGACVVLAARRQAELAAQVQEITAGGGQALGVPTDVSDPAQIERLVERTHQAFGRIDILVNNAGASWVKPVAQTEAEEMVGLLGANLLGAMMITRAVLPEMLVRRQGTIISVCSVQGRVAIEPLYSASKYGLRGFMLGLRRQLVGSGVSVSLVLPGNIRTAMTRELRQPMPGPELIAATIADLVLRPRREVIVPRKYHALVWLDQLLPGLADAAYSWRHHGDSKVADQSSYLLASPQSSRRS